MTLVKTIIKMTGQNNQHHFTENNQHHVAQNQHHHNVSFNLILEL